MAVTLEMVAEFLFAYAIRYREAYARATAAPPDGPGYPSLPISPFLQASHFEVYVAVDGVVINELRDEPKHQWYIAGGPALKVDYEPTRTPPAVTETLKANGLIGKPIGIYRIVAKSEIPTPVWRGSVSNIGRQLERRDTVSAITLILREVRGTLKEVVSSLSFGAYGIILDIHLPTQQSQIGEPHLIRNFGVFPADLSSRRFFSHLEIHGQSDAGAWDKRTVNLRVQQDIRRDLAGALADPGQSSGGTMAFGAGHSWVEIYSNRLERLRAAIGALRSALLMKADNVEAVFHEVISKHPLLLDVYGTCESKPQFVYPKGKTSPIGKTSLEPDFLIVYPDRSYKLVEIERPSKAVATAQGQPRSEVAQAVFQTAEWKHFIKTHYQELHSRYPGIQSKCKTAVVMSRTNQQSFKSIDDIRTYTGLIIEQFNIDEFLTFDDLYDRACTAYALLSGLSPNCI